jgi:hypothetical protein
MDSLALMAPWLLLGFLAAGVVGVCLPAGWVLRHLGGSGWRPVLWAALLGVPLPVCSCGVLPLAAGLRRGGASRGATASFLVATPQTGVDSLLATWGALGPLGPPLALLRAGLAFVSGILAGTVVERWGGVVAAPGACDNGSIPRPDAATPRWRRVLRAAAWELPGDLAHTLALGLLLATALTWLVPADGLTTVIGGGLGGMLLALAIGLPLYVCATAAIPIAAGLLHAGASPGTALVFLVAAPAANAAGLMAWARLLGLRGATLASLAVVVPTLAAGLAMDAWLSTPQVAEAAGQGSHSHAGPLDWAALSLLLALLAPHLLPWHRLRRRRGEVVTLAITGMTCDGCARKLRHALQSLPGVGNLDIDRPAGRARVWISAPAGLGGVLRAITDAGFAGRPLP